MSDEKERKARQIPVRLYLEEPDHERMHRAAKGRGLPLSSYARQAVLLLVKADVGEEEHETRPGVCREFRAGSDRCQESRRRDGLPPLEPDVGQDQEGRP